MASLAERVRRMIDNDGVDVLVEKTGLSRATLYNIARGGDPRISSLKKLRAAGLTIPRDLLLSA